MLKLTDEQNKKINEEVIDDTRRCFERAGFTPSKIARELAIIGFSDPADIVDVAEGGELQFKKFDEMGKKRRAIRKIREKTVITESKDGEQLYKTSTVEFDLHDKLDALGKAMGCIGITKPVQHEHAGNIKVIIQDCLD